MALFNEIHFELPVKTRINSPLNSTGVPDVLLYRVNWFKTHQNVVKMSGG